MTPRTNIAVERSPAGLAGRRSGRGRRSSVASSHGRLRSVSRALPMSCRHSIAACAARPRAWRSTMRSTRSSSRRSMRSTIRSAPKRAQRIEQELQQNLQALARGWRRALLFIVPGVIAGVALAFALAWWLTDAGVMRTLIVQSAAEVRLGQFRAGSPDRDDAARRRPRRHARALAGHQSSNSAVGRASARLARHLSG